MSKLLKAFSFAALLLVLVSGMAFASLEWAIEPAIPLDEGAVASAQAPDGSRLFVLTASGKILVLNAAGKVESTIPGPFKAETLLVSPDGKRLYLSGKGEKRLQVVSLLDRFDIPVGDSPVRGDIAAAVTVAVFSDFQWPYCARVTPLLDQLVEKYPGKVNIVFKNIPLPNHNMARPAAQAALAAHAQGKFWAYHDKVFEQFSSLTEEKFVSFAKELGLDMEKFNKDRNSPQIMNQINQDLRLGQTIGVRGTPTIFINGMLLENRSLQGAAQMVDEELKIRTKYLMQR